LGRARIRIKHRNAGWEQHKDEASGHHYFFHAQSRRATWTMAGIKKHVGEMWGTSAAQQPFGVRNSTAPAPQKGVAPEPIIEESGSGRFGDAPFGYEQDSKFQARESDWGVFADGRVSTAVTVQSNPIHSSPRGAAA
jgi:hypothetical protein